MPEAMLFSTQNIHLEKSLRYLISFSFHTIPKGNHLPILIQKLMRELYFSDIDKLQRSLDEIKSLFGEVLETWRLQRS